MVGEGQIEEGETRLGLRRTAGSHSEGSWQRNHTGPNMRYPRQRFALGREFKTCEPVGELEFQ